ncbi:MAG: hypothetical protein JXR37_07255 [Kiritimatiellae bacterium]|nr:hypothetical protein [Kiritimatiellia bacterium]
MSKHIAGVRREREHPGGDGCLPIRCGHGLSKRLTGVVYLLLAAFPLLSAGDVVTNSPTGAESSSQGPGAVVWVNPGNVVASEDAYAAATVSQGTSTRYLWASNFSFSVPAAAEIIGIEVVVERLDGDGKNCDSEVRLVKAGTVSTATNASSGASWSKFGETVVFGDPASLWNTTWTPAELNAADFGVVLAATRSNNGSADAQVDHIQVAVTYGPLANFAASSSSGAESATPATFDVVLGFAAASDVTVDYAVSGGTANNTVDYTLDSGTLTFDAGVTNKPISIAVTDDAIDEDNETIEVTLSNANGATLQAPTVHTYTIADNDTAYVDFDETASIGAESVTPANLVVALDMESAYTVTLNYAVSGGTASDPDDYTYESGTLTFDPGVTNKNISLTISDDAIDETDETVIVQLTGPSGALMGDNNLHTYTITDNEDADVDFDVTASSGDESVAGANLVVALDMESAYTVTVDYSVSGGTASDPADYTYESGTFTFDPGVTNKSLSLTVTDDAIDESNETIILQLSNASGAALGANTLHTYTITDNEDADVDFDLTAASGAESVAAVGLVVALNMESAYTVTVDYSVSGGSAGDPADYTYESGTFTFDPGVTNKSISVTVSEDAIDEPNETIIMQLSNASGAAMGANTLHTYTITDNEDADVDFDITGSGGDESVAGVNLVVALDMESAYTVTVDYSVAGGTASDPADYTYEAGTLTFDPGQTNKSVALTVTDDAIDEPDETVIVQASNASNAALGANALHTYTIADNEDADVDFDVSASSQSETASPANLVVALDMESAYTVTLDYAVSGGTAADPDDYSLADATLTFDPGQTNKTITLTVNDDEMEEGDETVEVTLSGASGAALGSISVHTFTISDDDAAEINFGEPASAGAESTTPVPLGVFLSLPSVFTIRVNYAVSGGTATDGVDFTLEAGTLTFDPGVTNKSFQLTVSDDDLHEANETVQMQLSGAVNATVGGTNVYTYTINDNDPADVHFDLSASGAAESATPANLAVSINRESELEITVDYAATDGTAGNGLDYTLAAATLTFEPGQTNRTISAAIADDAVDEGDETIVVELSGVVNATLGGTNLHTYTITDNDSADVDFDVSGSSGAESATPANLVVALDMESAYTVTVDYNVTGGTASDPADYSFSNGTLTFNPGVTNLNVSFTVADDALDESNETVEVTLSGASGAALGSTAVHTYTLTDNDTAQTAFNVSSSAGSETVSPVLLGVNLSLESVYTVTVDYVVSGGTASNTVDYTLEDATLTFNPGVTNLDISVTIISDEESEDDETIEVTLTNVSDAALGAVAVHTFTIIDAVANFDLTASTGSEQDDPALLAVSLNQSSAATVTVDYAVSGGTAGNTVDFILEAGTLTFDPGVTNMNLSVDILQDALCEPDETIEVLLSNAWNAQVGSNSLHTYTLTDSDGPPGVRINNASIDEGNSGAADMILNVWIDHKSVWDVEADFATSNDTATAGSDYAATNGVLTISAGSTNTTVAVSVQGDTGDERPYEDFYVNVSNPTNATIVDGCARGRINDEDVDSGSPAATTSPVTNITQTGATLCGEITGGSPTPNVYVCWGPETAGGDPCAWSNVLDLGALTGTFATNISGTAAGNVYYYGVFVSNSVNCGWSDLARCWTVQRWDTNQWYLFSVPACWGHSDSNNLNSTLGQMIASGLTSGSGQDQADNLWLWQNGDWARYWLAAGNVWKTGGADADVELSPGEGLWVKRLTTTPIGDTVISGIAHTNAAAITFSNAAWTVFSWPYATRAEDEGADPGWAFWRAGGTGGTTWENSDNIMGNYGATPFQIYLRTDGRWYVRDTQTPAGVSLEPGMAYYYYHRGSPFTWAAPQE